MGGREPSDQPLASLWGSLPGHPSTLGPPSVYAGLISEMPPQPVSSSPPSGTCFTFYTSLTP